MAELNPAPAVRIEPASSNEQGTARDARPGQLRKISRTAAAPVRALEFPDLDLDEDEKQQKHRLDERA